MTPLLLLLLPTLASAVTALASAVTEFALSLSGLSNTSSFDPAEGASIGKVGDKVKNAVNDPLTKEGYQDCYDLMGIADAWILQKANFPIPITTLVVDSGINLKHEDLENKLATDTEGRHGYNFDSGTDDITDSDGHGTYVAGIVAAEVNNGKGLVGVDPLGRILTGDTGISLRAAALAVPYALKNGAQVVLMPFGTYEESPPLESLRDAMWKAQQSKNMFFVMSADNSGVDTPYFPCAYHSPYTLCVGASMSDKRMLWPLSNYGLDVEVAAPGVNIASTFKDETDEYSRTSGTSAATAIVAGVVSMMLSVGIDADRIRPLLVTTCDPLIPNEADPGKHIAVGFVNASRAMRKGLGLPL